LIGRPVGPSCALSRELGFPDKSGSRFATLVTLYAFGPLSVTAADLAYHAEVSRASMTSVIEALEQRGLVMRDAGGRDRITPIHLTELGQQVAVLAVHRFLQLASNLAGNIGPPNGKATVQTCEQAESRAAGPAS
jgi:DNA-binding MarR family transcriptional regulator